MFREARLKLTAWYLLIIMAISIIFSMAIYTRINSDLVKFEQMQVRFQTDIREGRVREIFDNHPVRPPRLSPEEIREARIRLIASLGAMNLMILIISGVAGYFLAGRTLRPIQTMLDEQNRFISDSSHELRTPLTSLRSEIEVGLRNKKITISEAKEILQSNLEEVINLQNLSDNLLELAQNGNMINKNMMKEISLLSCVNEAIKKLEGKSREKQITVENKVKNMKINGISDRLTEVFVILIDNAIKYSPKKSNIKIESKKTDGKIQILVTDFGEGIEKEDGEHIFERFYRAEKSRNKPGYGLGLSIAKKITELHNGNLSFKSEPNKSTTFIVKLPSN